MTRAFAVLAAMGLPALVLAQVLGGSSVNPAGRSTRPLSAPGYTGTGSTLSDSAPLGAEFLTGTGWTSTGWTGSYAAGWTHTAGNTTALSYATAAVNATKYQITYTITGRTAGTVTLSFGAQASVAVSATGAYGPTTTSTANLTATPTTDFDGTLVVSIKAITGGSSALIVLRDSAGTIRNEVRAINQTGNTNIGVSALRSNTTGAYNTASGYQALSSNTTGADNTASGHLALSSNTTGGGNIASGHLALFSNTTGYYNTASGRQALYSNTIGFYNTASGLQALYSNTIGDNNTASGLQALYANTTGASNTASGHQAGRFRADGSTPNTDSGTSVFLGTGTKAAGATGANEIVIGASAIGNGSNSATLGHTTVTKTFLRGSVNISTLALPTCGAGAGETPEGGIVMVAGASTVPTKMCVCTYTPTGTVYAWVNALANSGGTGIGNTTTCP